MKVTVDKDTEAYPKTETQLQQEALSRALIADAEEASKYKPREESGRTPEEKASLKQALSGTLEERVKEEKTIVLKFVYGQTPEVKFFGFWNGRLIKNAQNAIARAYRQIRHKNVRAHANVPTTQKEIGDDRTKKQPRR